MPDPFPQQLVTTSLTISHGSLNLKAAAVFYDRIIILDDSLFETHVGNLLGPELDFLENAGIVEIRASRRIREFDLEAENGELLSTTSDIMMQSLFAPTHDPLRMQLRRKGANGIARLEALQLSKENAEVTFVPNVSGGEPAYLLESISSHIQYRNVRALEILFNKIPVPSEDTPWQEIVDFRNDPSTRSQAWALNKWMCGNITDEYFPKLKGLLAHEIWSLEKALKDHHIKKRNLRMKTIVPAMTLAGIASPLFSSQDFDTLFAAFTSLASLTALVDIRLVKGDLLEEETKFRMNPLYMFVDLKNRFSNSVK